jgi:hypothetical protein
MEFFNSVTTQSLRPCPPLKEGRLPMEIYHMILERVDDDLTYNACAKVSRRFRDYYFRNIRLGRSTIIIDCDDWMKLTIRERGRRFDYTETTQWSVIIESCDRPSLLDQVWVAFYSLIVQPRSSSQEPRTFGIPSSIHSR